MTTGARALVGGAAALLVPAVLAAVGAIVLARRVRSAAHAATAPFPGSAGGRRGEAGPPGSVEAIVVFGATVDASGPSNELRARLDHAVHLFLSVAAPVVMAAGGVADGIDEVEAMIAYLVAHGVDAGAVVPVRPGDNTRLSLRTVRGLGVRRIVAVSSPYHAHRIEVEARRQGLDVSVSAPRSTPETRHRPTYRARFASEVVAAVWYALPSSVAGRVRTGPGTLRHVAPQVLAGQAAPTELLRHRDHA